LNNRFIHFEKIVGNNFKLIPKVFATSDILCPNQFMDDSLDRSKSLLYKSQGQSLFALQKNKTDENSFINDYFNLFKRVMD
jgi:hypothetical protein